MTAVTAIQTDIELAGILNDTICSINCTISAMADMWDAVSEWTALAVNAIQAGAAEMTGLVINVDVTPVIPDPLVPKPQAVRPDVIPNAPPETVQIPIEWQSGGLDVFTGSGAERFRQEVQSADAMLQQLSSTQDAIAKQAYDTRIFPNEAFGNLNSMTVRIDNIRERIQQITNNHMNFGTDAANKELEHLRSQLSQAVSEQNKLNAAMGNMDVSAANDAYLRLNQTVSGTERYIRDNVDEQGRFNQGIGKGSSQAEALLKTIKDAAASYINIESIGKVLEISDELVQTTSRLNMMNDGVQTTQDLMNMVYLSAQNARGSFSEMVNVVAGLGSNAGSVFGSSAELVAFAELVQKQMTLAGASATEASAGMEKLSEALGSGVIHGEELNSIFGQAPSLVQDIADYLGVGTDELNKMANEGQLTSDIVRNAIFAAADEINANFESMPMTWGQIWGSFQNAALFAFQPILQRLNDIANTEAFQSFLNGAVGAMAVLAGILLNILDLVMTAGGFIADNWSVLSPLIYGVIAALAVYGAYLAITEGLEMAGTIASGVLAAAQFVKTAAMAASTRATISTATAQEGLNGAMYACPIAWTIGLILALIAALFVVCNAIAKTEIAANSGLGVITGGINVVIQFFKNLGLAVANIALGIGSAIAALADNMTVAFHNAISWVQSRFYSLLSTALSVTGEICAALNMLPFVEFDYSGISNAADYYAAKAAKAAGNKEEYKSISDAFNEGFSTFEAFQSGWVSDAFKAGASLGDSIADKFSNFSLSDIFGSTDMPDPEDYVSGFGDAITDSGMADSIGSIDGNTGAIRDSMEIMQEDLKYLRDIAEQETVNRYTVAEVNVDMSGMKNTVNNSTDLDGFVSELTDAVNEAVDSIAEGVHG